jgi:NAD(P)-dependent dehydrogenase (short-subunit alcohol dehydrogenase family)
MKEKNVEFDCIVANAAIGIDHKKVMPLEESSSRILRTNVVSTIDFIKQFIPLLSETGRVVIVSSNFGGLKFHKQEFISRIDNPLITEQEILSIVD